MLARSINLNPGLILGIDNDTVWYDLPLCNCIVSMTKDKIKLVLREISKIMVKNGVYLKIVSYQKQIKYTIFWS